MRTSTLIYTSCSTESVTAESLEELARISSRNNAASGITGLLLYGAGNFLQVLEGRRAAIDLIYDRICHDTRHANCELLYQAVREGRLFPDWNMGALNLDGPEQSASNGWDLISMTLAKAGAVNWQQTDPALVWVRQFIDRNGSKSAA